MVPELCLNGSGSPISRCRFAPSVEISTHVPALFTVNPMQTTHLWSESKCTIQQTIGHYRTAILFDVQASTRGFTASLAELTSRFESRPTQPTAAPASGVLSAPFHNCQSDFSAAYCAQCVLWTYESGRSSPGRPTPGRLLLDSNHAQRNFPCHVRDGPRGPQYLLL